MRNSITHAWRASVLNPLTPNQWQFWEDGILISRDGKIECVGDASKILPMFPTIEPLRLEGVLIPGFTDLHCHWVQHNVQGIYGGELMDWLQNYIWPEEANYESYAYARKQAQHFYFDMLRSGTIMGMSFSSVHEEALNAAFTEMKGDWIIGNALMAVNAPEYLTGHSLHDPSAFNQIALSVPDNRYAVTPRFAPNMRRQEMELAGRIAKRFQFPVQTHLSESIAEMKLVSELFPEANSYTEVYDQAGLLGRRTILAHCLHMLDEEWECLAMRGSWVAHCPSSNEALDNPRMRLEKVREFRIPWGLGSDIGAGPSHSMLHVLQRFLVIQRQSGIPVTAQEALYRATLAGAQAMGRDKEAGNFAPGKRANFILMPGNPSVTELEGWFMELVRGSIRELEHRNLGTWIDGEIVEIEGLV